MKSERLPLYLASGLTVILFVILAIIFRSFVRENIVVPIYYVIWLGGLVINFIPQSLYLVLLVGIGFWFSLRTLFAAEKIKEKRTQEKWIPDGLSRYKYWQRKIDLLRISQFSMETFSIELIRLIINILSQQEHLSPSDVESMIKNGTLEVPDDVRNLFKNRILGISTKNDNFIKKLALWFNYLIHQREIKQGNSPAEHQLQNVIKFIEQRLEVNSGRFNERYPNT